MSGIIRKIVYIRFVIDFVIDSSLRTWMGVPSGVGRLINVVQVLSFSSNMWLGNANCEWDRPLFQTDCFLVDVPPSYNARWLMMIWQGEERLDRDMKSLQEPTWKCVPVSKRRVTHSENDSICNWVTPYLSTTYRKGPPSYRTPSNYRYIMTYPHVQPS